MSSPANRSSIGAKKLAGLSSIPSAGTQETTVVATRRKNLTDPSAFSANSRRRKGIGYGDIREKPPSPNSKLDRNSKPQAPRKPGRFPSPTKGCETKFFA